MFCVTGAERNLSDLNARLLRNRNCSMQEIRLDKLQGHEVPSVEKMDSSRLVVTCRRQGEGGDFKGSEGERARLLAQFVRTVCPGWVDVELSTTRSERKMIFDAARDVGTRILVSHHEFRPGRLHSLEEVVPDMVSLGVDGIKVAYMVEDAADLVFLKDRTRQWKETKIVIGMGAAGLISRVLYRKFGSAWTYVAEGAETSTAKGQLTLDQASHLGMPLPLHGDLYVLLGSGQVMASPGPDVYNRFFKKMGIEACYLPVITSDPQKTIPLLRALGLKGASVTMPLKEKVIKELKSISDVARRANAVNTITVNEKGDLEGDLTDGLGALRAIRGKLGPAETGRAVIIGTGSTAQAIGASLGADGFEVVLLGRNKERAMRAASQISASYGHLSDLSHLPFAVLVNATPVGSADSDGSLIDQPELLRGKVVLDVVIGKETLLKRDVQLHGGVFISGRTMWAEQGRLQLRRWFGLDVPAIELEVDS